tara:strand:+ start:243 stop:395 length:153 start_codon:yes stop_codon:yes gene_type:complete
MSRKLINKQDVINRLGQIIEHDSDKKIADECRQFYRELKAVWRRIEGLNQ